MKTKETTKICKFINQSVTITCCESYELGTQDPLKSIECSDLGPKCKDFSCKYYYEDEEIGDRKNPF